LKQGPYPNLKYVILVGTHEVIPMEARKVTSGGSEATWAAGLPQKSGYLYDIYHTTQGNADGYFLSDLAYRDLANIFVAYPGKWIEDEYVPELSVGRLVETPDQIRGILNAYMNVKGILPGVNRVSITSEDFTKAGGWAAKYMGTSTDTTLVLKGFLSSLVPPKLNAKHDIAFLAGHGTPNSMTTRKWDQSFMAGADPNQGDTSELNAMPNAVLVAEGCHMGVNFGNRLYHAPDGTTKYADFPEEFAAKQVGVYLAATTYTYGDCCGKKLATDYIDKLLSKGHKQTTGLAHNDAIMQYIFDHGEYTGFWGPTHRQVLAYSTLYGLPTYGWKAPLTAKIDDNWFGYWMIRRCEDCPFGPLQDIIDWKLKKYEILPDGLIRIEGASYGSGGVDLPVLPRIPHARVLPLGSATGEIVWDEAASESVVIENDVPLDTASRINATADGVVRYGTGEFDYPGFYPPEPFAAMTGPAPGGDAVRAGLVIRPVQYNPTTHQTRIWTSLVFSVTYDVVVEDLSLDGDSDTLPDYWEAGYGLNRYNAYEQDGPDGDGDGDGLLNTEEFHLGTNPLNPDTDGDGVADDAEIAAGTDPLNPGERLWTLYVPILLRGVE
jgi:hypothetical protein